MSIIQRPTKQGNATTYQGKVAAGYTKILAAEVDADLDLIYSAWNQGVDTVNIRDGSINGAKLAPGAVGTRELADGGVQTVDIGDGQVTTPKIADGNVTAVKLVGGGVMGGDLTGTFPNPSLGVVQGDRVQLNTRAALLATPSYASVEGNASNDHAFDNTKPSWNLTLNYGADAAELWRAPAPGTAWTKPFAVQGSDGKTYCTLADQSVAHGALSINAVWGSSSGASVPASFNLSNPNTWTTYVTLPAITTRGGFVMLIANTNLSVGSVPAGSVVSQRWFRDGSVVTGVKSNLVATASGNYVPLPPLNCFIDGTAPAGVHTYAYQVYVQSSVNVIASGFTDGFMQALELG